MTYKLEIIIREVGRNLQHQPITEESTFFEHTELLNNVPFIYQLIKKTSLQSPKTNIIHIIILTQ